MSLPQHTLDTATNDLVSTFVCPQTAAPEQLDVLEVLTQQLAEQHIPLCSPSLPLLPARPSLSSARLRHATDPFDCHYLLERYFQDVPTCIEAPHESSQQPLRDQCQAAPLQDRLSMHCALGCAPGIQRPAVSCQELPFAQPLHLHLASSCIESQHQMLLSPAEAHLLSTAQHHSPASIFLQETATSLLFSSSICACSLCQSAEVLRLRSSRGQTWKGLALRQAILGRAVGQSDDEASVQDAAGGGGLLHGGAEDGGEGGGPSRSAIKHDALTNALPGCVFIQHTRFAVDSTWFSTCFDLQQHAIDHCKESGRCFSLQSAI